MRKIREILRLRHEKGLSQRAVAAVCGQSLEPSRTSCRQKACAWPRASDCQEPSGGSFAGGRHITSIPFTAYLRGAPSTGAPDRERPPRLDFAGNALQKVIQRFPNFKLGSGHLF